MSYHNPQIGYIMLAMGAILLGISFGVIPLSSISANPQSITGTSVLANRMCTTQFGAGQCPTVYFAWTGNEVPPSQAAAIITQETHQTYTDSCNLPYAIYSTNIPVVQPTPSGGTYPNFTPVTVPDGAYTPAYNGVYLQVFVVGTTTYIQYLTYGAPDGCGTVTYQSSTSTTTGSTTHTSSTTHTTTSKSSNSIGFGLPPGFGSFSTSLSQITGLVGLVLTAMGVLWIRGKDLPV